MKHLYHCGVKLKPQKCQILQEEVKFLGYVIKRGQLRIAHEKVKSFLELPCPQTRLQLRYYLNSTAYFRTSIPDFALHSAVLYELVNNSDASKKNKIHFKMEKQHVEAFERLQEQIENFLPLTNPDFDREFYLMTDASCLAISFVLFQLDSPPQQEEEDNDIDYREVSNLEKLIQLPKRFITCGSRKLSPKLKTQSIFKLELMAILYALKTTRQIVQFSPIKLFSDCRSVLHIRLSKTQSPELQRSSLLLSTFQISLYHVPRELNTFCDYLGRPAETSEKEGDLSTLTPHQSDAILRSLIVHDDLRISSEELHRILIQESPQAILKEAGKARKNQ